MQHVVGNYKIVGQLGAGGMGTVYRAEHLLLRRPAAIKVLAPEYAASPGMAMRFLNEARAVSAIRHPGIIEIFDFGHLADGTPYIAMELLRGETLGERLRRRGSLGEGEALTIVRGIAAALAAGHVSGVIHRDVKPDNVFLVPDADTRSSERVKLLDYGIAKFTRQAEAGLTGVGTILGTPSYMAPEQCRGGDVDHRVDLYALGCILFELLSGRPPFLGEGAGEVIGAQQHLLPPRLRFLVPNLSAPTEAIVDMLLEKLPARRIQSARELLDRLGAPAEQDQVPAHARLTARALPFQPPPATTLALAPLVRAVVSDSSPRPNGRRALVVGAASALAALLGLLVIGVTGSMRAGRPSFTNVVPLDASTSQLDVAIATDAATPKVPVVTPIAPEALDAGTVAPPPADPAPDLADEPAPARGAPQPAKSPPAPARRPAAREPGAVQRRTPEPPLLAPPVAGPPAPEPRVPPAATRRQPPAPPRIRSPR